MRTLNLTGDRPLTKSEARKLAEWWQGSGWSCSLRKVGRFYAVLASKGG